VDFFLQQVYNGLFLGAIYALIALGYTMVYGILRFINFAHGEVYMVGAFVAYFAANLLIPITGTGWLALILILVLAMAVCALLGVAIEWTVYRPLRHRPRLTVLITAIGVSLFLQYGGQTLIGADPKAFPTIVESNPVQIGSITTNNVQILVLIITVILMLALRYFVLKTKLGKARRAVSHNVQAASLMGINNDRVISVTFAVGSALAAAAGVLYAMIYPSIDPLMGLLPGLKAFVAAVLGGIGNIPGAALGGLVLGIVETFAGGSTVLSPYRDAIAFGLLVLILLFRPGGLLGKATVEKV